MGGHSNIFTMFMPDGTAKDESGKDIYFRDVDQEKLHAGRQGKFPGWSITPGEGFDGDAKIPVNNKKGGVGNLFFPSTSLVRSSLKQVDAGMREPQYASGFSQSAVETPVSSSVPSSQGFVDPMPQEVATPVLQESYGWLGKSASDDDNQSNVGQIS